MITSILEAIVTGKEWSWSVVGLIALLLGLGIRALVLRDILRGIKLRNRQLYDRVQSYYQGRSVFGWIFFIGFVIGSMLLWRFDSFLTRYLDLVVWSLVLMAFLMLALLVHLRGYARAIVDAMQESLGSDKDI